MARLCKRQLIKLNAENNDAIAGVFTGNNFTTSNEFVGENTNKGDAIARALYNIAERSAKGLRKR
jgi:hypothetical protein